MPKKTFSYTETIKITVYVDCENKKQAQEAGSDFVEGLLDHSQTEFEFCKKQGAKSFEMETLHFSVE